jgi:hypothetical protein
LPEFRNPVAEISLTNQWEKVPSSRSNERNLPGFGYLSHLGF